MKYYVSMHYFDKNLSLIPQCNGIALYKDRRIYSFGDKPIALSLSIARHCIKYVLSHPSYYRTDCKHKITKI